MKDVNVYWTYLFGTLSILMAQLDSLESTELTMRDCNSNNFCAVLAKKGKCAVKDGFMEEECPGFCDACKNLNKGEPSRGLALVASEDKPKHEYDCADAPQANCDKYLGLGKCQNDVETMKDVCSETCGFCVYDNLCLDRDKKCGEFANSGECAKNATYMNEFCPVTCGKCDGLCLDLSKTCAKLTSEGQCDSNSTYMAEFCPVSCAACDSDTLCLDKNKKCQELAQKGECANNFTYMETFCPSSCGKCGPDGKCLDQNRKCAELALKGDCQTNEDYMKTVCPKACDKCQKEEEEEEGEEEEEPVSASVAGMGIEEAFTFLLNAINCHQKTDSTVVLEEVLTAHQICNSNVYMRDRKCLFPCMANELGLVLRGKLMEQKVSQFLYKQFSNIDIGIRMNWMAGIQKCFNQYGADGADGDRFPTEFNNCPKNELVELTICLLIARNCPIVNHKDLAVPPSNATGRILPLLLAGIAGNAWVADASHTLQNNIGCSGRSWCKKGYCAADCDATFIPNEWCYTTKSYSQSFKYVKCKRGSECSSCWKCAGSCTV